MKLSKLLHVVSVAMGFIGMAMSAIAVLFWPAGVVWFGLTREVMLLCSITSLLAAIWIQIATIHHMMLERKGGIL
ncbi:MAG: hypothetical protein A2751_06045 [Candidatus Doudnabacteria bacterium RIFCSPHIGHO2_01_FULL_46_14]|uniref:Uncharacterized protein n=1 Tax=Candidatus Doudnabacteria bacterium RIFCSPHIGHO2_01_FULL_46_14 TaxID=1817824 RepID=A0A1F5NK28_9BACT|nr:MAG: hypothetical protein A2751_06045 [Candidatus Doudnabacteria bacterium RIFCSPHIGHO2_01_FULL_46_14]